MSPLLSFTMPALTAALLAFVLAPLASRLAVRIGAVDAPGGRKIHTAAIPRLGGLAVVGSISLVLAAVPILSGGLWEVPSHLITPLALGVLPVFLVSLVDDIITVGTGKKLLAHTVGASIAVASGVSLEPVVHLFGSPIHIGIFAGPLSILWIVGITNAFNLIDGLDGLSAGLALISAASMAAVFMLLGQSQMGGVVLVLAGALVGFLPYNVHPARMFLGDSGSTVIGFCLAAFALKGGSTLTSGFAALLPVFMLGLPIADTLITVVRRMVGNLENSAGGVFVPDRNHIHHRLLALGIDHRSAVFILYGVGLLLATAAFASVFLNARQAGLFMGALLIAGFVGVQRLGYAEFAFVRRGTVMKVYELPAVKRGMFVVFVDIFVAAVAAYLAVGLKSDEWSLKVAREAVFELTTTFAPVTVLLFWLLGMYRGSWRVAVLQDLAKVITAVVSVTLAGAVVVDLVSGGRYPPSLFVIYGIISLLLTSLLRSSYVVLEAIRLQANHEGTPTLVYGAGNTGVAAVRAVFRNSTSGLRPIAFIDDDARKSGRLVSGLPVLGSESDIKRIVETHSVQAVLIATEAIQQDRIDRILDVCRGVEVAVYRFNVNIEPLSSNEVVPFPQRRRTSLSPVEAAPARTAMAQSIATGVTTSPNVADRRRL